MTALNLASASRVLTIPTAPFTSVAYGDINISTLTPPHPVGSFGSFPVIPRIADDGASNLDQTGGGYYVPSLNMATFIAVTGPIAGYTTYSWPVIDDTVSLALTPTKVAYAAVHGIDNTNGGSWIINSASAGVTLTTPHDAGVTVYAIVNNSTAKFIANNKQGVIATAGRKTVAATDSTPIFRADENDPIIDGDHSKGILGVWYFDGVNVSETDALDTLTEIAALFVEPEPPASSGGFMLYSKVQADAAIAAAIATVPAPVPGVPNGGVIGSVLTKASAADQDLAWIMPPVGGGGGGGASIHVGTEPPASTGGFWYDTDEVTVPGGGGPVEVRHDNTGTYDYVGQAPAGTADGATGWKITRITLNVSPPVIKTATGTWTGRAGLTYA